MLSGFPHDRIGVAGCGFNLVVDAIVEAGTGGIDGAGPQPGVRPGNKRQQGVLARTDPETEQLDPAFKPARR